ncbi:ABC transporter permease subunit [Planctomycetota bacterium]
MPIISRIGRRSPKVRALIWSIYVLLTLGALTMLYPFLIMVAGSTKSAVDIKEFIPVPQYVHSDLALYRKHIEGLFNESLDAMHISYDDDTPSFEHVALPEAPNDKLVAEWQRFLDEADLPHYAYTIGYMDTPVSKTTPQAQRAFKHELMARFDKDIEACNGELGTEFATWQAFFVLREDYLLRRNKPSDDAFALALRDFKARQPRNGRTYFSVEGFYKSLFLKTQYTKKIDEYNREHGTAYASYTDVHLTRRVPKDSPKEAKDWEEFVRNTLNLLWLRADEGSAPAYHAFLKAKYRDVAVLNRNYTTQYASFDDVPLVEEPPNGGLVLSDWEAFIAGWKDPDSDTLHILPSELIRIHSVEFLFRDHLERKFGAIGAVNAQLGTTATSFVDILPPQRDAHYFAFTGQRRRLAWEFTTRNYKAVLDYMLYHGRGIVNTVIYCSLAVLFALLVNPLAAYAMSRYKMPTSYKILLFLMLTMAFPPMVTQIPVFLMLRELGLLNTFAALVLPGLANGYAIFLLKGFFDSLPRELYESASIDGASEWTMFWHITMSLSKPILAVIGLQAFTMAYSNFMFALLICQDHRMWTLMVWLYELQQQKGQGVIYASLLIAAIPTFVIFVFAQKIIMRGIVVPVEK